jgi:ATP-binding cassette subfamily B protein
MIKKLLSYAKGYRFYAFLSPLAIIFEVLIEVAIPFLMSVIVDSGINGIPLSQKEGFVVDILLKMGFGEKQGLELVTSTGLLMIIMACFSLICGASAAYFAASVFP